jgi:hypothetical protein
MKIGTTDHVRLVARETAGGTANYVKCLHCRTEVHVLGLGLAKAWDALDKEMKAFERSHRHCKGPIVELPPPGTPEEWLAGDDTGISSLTIYSVMTGVRVSRTGIPHDSDDFGRCYRLLKLFPEWRARLTEVADRYPEWRGLVSVWGELEALYEQGLGDGDESKLYLRILGMRVAKAGK